MVEPLSFNLVDGLYYITHVDNLQSILDLGILSHRDVEQRGIRYTPIYDQQIVSRRERTKTPEGRSLWHYINLYFQPRNPMLFRVLQEIEDADDKIVILKLRRDLISQARFITDGNAAHSQSTIYDRPQAPIEDIRNGLNLQYWKAEDGSKRRIMAEALMADTVSPDYIECIYVAQNSDSKIYNRVKGIIQASRYPAIDIVSEPALFFRPEAINLLKQGSNVSFAKGDMFFSRLQTLTISVNTKGVMGRGLASRTRYQFPDVYVKYQDVCKLRKKGQPPPLDVGRPYLVKRESSLAEELSELPQPADEKNATWFLLFATKRHWKEESRIEYIRDGMQYLLNHYQEWGIKSLALPALGCGLGGLSWQTVGPVLTQAAVQMRIPVCIYLPAEQTVPREHLRPEFLLAGT
jgi:O-acetyl-ADP-ribose deacetylase (regulator of RNase III)